MAWHAPGFASVLRWQLPVVAGETERVTPLSLIPGGSILGDVELDDVRATDDSVSTAGSSPRAVTVELVVAGAQSTHRDSRRRLDYLRQRSSVGTDGRFQFTGLSPGTYRITATAEGMGLAGRPAVQVLEGRETVLLEPLRLRPLTTQTVRVRPPRTPAGRPWIISVRLPMGSPGVAPCRTDETGACRLY